MATVAYEIRLNDLFFERTPPESVGATVDRTEAVRKALRKGIPLHQIEASLDWADAIRDGNRKK